MKLVKYSLAVICALVAFQVNAQDAVSRATFTTAIDNREPTDEVTNLDNDASKIYYFTEIKFHSGTKYFQPNFANPKHINFGYGACSYGC